MPRLSSFLLLLLLLLTVACLLTSANANGNNNHNDDDDDSDGQRHPVVCTDDTWRQYVGNTNPLPRNPRRRCYDPPNPPSGNTIEKRIITEYAYNTLVARNYDGYAFFSSPGTWLKVPQLGITVDGQTAVIGYFVLGDLDVTDIVLFWAIDIIDIIQDGLKAAAQVSIFEFAPHFGGNFTTYNTWFFEFHPNRTIKSQTLYVDTYSVVTKIGNAESDPAINCPLIQERCTGPYQQYTDVDDCIAFMNTKPDGTFNQPGIYDTKYCRGFHLLLTINRPEIHCPHTGKNSEVCAGAPPF